MDASIYALYVSIGSLVIASLALGWNIYRDVILKPRLIVKFNLKGVNRTNENPPRIFLVNPVELPHMQGKYFFILEITNKGPGKIKIVNIIATKSLIQRIKKYKQEASAVIIPDIEPPLSVNLPIVVDQSEDTTVGFKVTAENRMDLANYQYIGVTDTYDRKHWAKSNDIKRALADLKKCEQEENNAT